MEAALLSFLETRPSALWLHFRNVFKGTVSHEDMFRPVPLLFFSQPRQRVSGPSWSCLFFPPPTSSSSPPLILFRDRLSLCPFCRLASVKLKAATHAPFCVYQAHVFSRLDVPVWDSNGTCIDVPPRCSIFWAFLPPIVLYFLDCWSRFLSCVGHPPSTLQWIHLGFKNLSFCLPPFYPAVWLVPGYTWVPFVFLLSPQQHIGVYAVRHCSDISCAFHDADPLRRMVILAIFLTRGCPWEDDSLSDPSQVGAPPLPSKNSASFRGWDFKRVPRISDHPQRFSCPQACRVICLPCVSLCSLPFGELLFVVPFFQPPERTDS